MSKKPQKRSSSSTLDHPNKKRASDPVEEIPKKISLWEIAADFAKGHFAKTSVTENDSDIPEDTSKTNEESDSATIPITPVVSDIESDSTTIPIIVISSDIENDSGTIPTTPDSFEDSVHPTCWGCKSNPPQPNQLAHMDYGGCLYMGSSSDSETDDPKSQ